MGTADRDFGEWYRAEHPRVIGSMLLLCRDVDVAAEVTDEAFARWSWCWSSAQL